VYVVADVDHDCLVIIRKIYMQGKLLLLLCVCRGGRPDSIQDSGGAVGQVYSLQEGAAQPLPGVRVPRSRTGGLRPNRRRRWLESTVLIREVAAPGVGGPRMAGRRE
jgi:hypothetical protein